MARKKLGTGDSLRFQMKISQEEMEAIEMWRYSHRVPSTSEAIRDLCRVGLRSMSERDRVKAILLDHEPYVGAYVHDLIRAIDGADNG